MRTTLRTGLSLLAGLAVAVALLAGLTLATPSAALAASPSEQACIDAGGTFDRTNGEVSCAFATSDPVGNSESSGGKSQTRDTETTTTGQGNDGNKPAETGCTSGPGNQSSC